MPKTLVICLCLTLVVGLPPAARAGADNVGKQREKVLFWSQAKRDADFAHMYRIFPADKVDAGKDTRQLPDGKALQPQWHDPAITLDTYMQRYHVHGVMVLQHGRVRLERYALGSDADTHWTSFSVAKSVTSMLLGVALKQGDVDSLNDRVGDYVPELADSAYADVTVRQLLTMTSGVRWNEDYTDPDSDVSQMYRQACVDDEAHILPYLKQLPRAHAVGQHFNYNTAETDLLGVLVQRATGESLAQYLAENVWQPYGMVADAWWLKDECADSNTGGSGLSATLADYARIGQFMLEDGRIDDTSVLAATWRNNATQMKETPGDSGHGYGYLWWVDPDGSYAAVGIFGQLIYVDPGRGLVIAQNAAWPDAYSDAEVQARRDFVAAVKRAVDDETDNPHASN